MTARQVSLRGAEEKGGEEEMGRASSPPRFLLQGGCLCILAASSRQSARNLLHSGPSWGWLPSRPGTTIQRPGPIRVGETEPKGRGLSTHPLLGTTPLPSALLGPDLSAQVGGPLTVGYLPQVEGPAGSPSKVDGQFASRQSLGD